LISDQGLTEHLLDLGLEGRIVAVALELELVVGDHGLLVAVAQADLDLADHRRVDVLVAA
jgi:hypothetical protein